MSPQEPKPVNAPPEHETHHYATGAVRSKDADSARFDLVPTVGLRRVAETCKEGFDKYGKDNWKKGFPIDDCINHAMRHINLYNEGDRTEDHLAHACWNLMVSMHFEENPKPGFDPYTGLPLKPKSE